MASNEHSAGEAAAQSVALRRGAFRRFGIYAVVVIALLVVIWALIEGAERDLWTQPSSLGHPTALLAA